MKTGFFRKEPTMVERGKMIKRIFKKGVVSEYLPWLLISLILLVVVVISIFFLKQKGTSLIDSIRNIFRGR